jgi:hypothetical protein
MLSEIFYSLLLTSSIAFILAMMRLCYKSKCSSIEISYKGIKIIRDVINEEKIDEIQIIQKKSNNENLEEKI